MSIISFIKSKFGLNHSSEKPMAVEQRIIPNYEHVASGENAVPEEVADSSSIPENEKQYYRPDEYYTTKVFGRPVITFDERKKTCIPSQGGLYVAEILLLDYCNKGRYPPSVKSGYPGFWWFQYGIRDVGGALRSLEKRNYISMNPVSQKYVLTESGKSELIDNEYVPYMHRRTALDITVWDLNLQLGTGDKSKYLDIIFSNYENFDKSFLSQAKSYDVEYPYIEISTSGDENVCPMCRQFNRKLFRAPDVPPLPLHPFCGCGYMYRETAGKRKIYNPSDFVLPDPCTKEFCDISSKIDAEKDIYKRIELCEIGLKLLKEFLSPYVSTGWEPPEVLPCAYGLIFDYQSLGDWDNAERVITACIDAGAYSQKDGEEESKWNECVKDAAQALIAFLIDNPGALQRNVYRKLCPPCDREALKWVLAKSLQIRKEKFDKTYKLFVK